MEATMEATMERFSQDSPQFAAAVARRILASEGCSSYAQGHVSIRAEDGESFWITPWQYQDETLPDDLVRVDFSGNRIEGSLKPYSRANGFHAAIYKERSDINSIVHTHSYWVQVVSTTGRVVGSYCGEATFIHDDQVFLEDEQEFLKDEARPLARSLGEDKHIIVLKNHGSITTGSSVRDATVRAVMLEHCAKLHIDAEAAGGTPFVPDAFFIQDFWDNVAPAIWDSCVRRLPRNAPDLLAARA